MQAEREWGIEKECEVEKGWVTRAVRDQSQWVAEAALIPRPEWAAA
jgi:hypothetical protein